MFSTYQRALASAGLSIPAAMANKRRFIAALRGRLSDKGKSAALRQQRHNFYRVCLQYLQDDYDIMKSFRF